MNFQEITQTSWTQTAPNTKTLDALPDTWLQGRTLFGGVGAAAALSSLRPLMDKGRQPRSIQCSFNGPITGASTLKTETLREGSSITFARAEIHQDETLRLAMNAVLGGDRESTVSLPYAGVQDLPKREDLPEMPFLQGLTPNFTQHFAYRWAAGDLPFTGGEGRLIHGWCRHRTETGGNYEAVLGLLDAWPCPALGALKGLAMASTVTWTVSFIDVPETITSDDWFWFQSDVQEASNGYAHMRGALYTATGNLVAHFEQLVAVFG